MAESEYESVLCVKPEVHVYRIPPRATNRRYRAADWKLDQPDWTGRLRITAKGNMAYIKLEDRNSGELFAQSPVDQFPGIAVESVVDSSRYFVIRIEDGNGRRAFIGIGFVDRGDAFDFNVGLQDHFKWVKQQTELAKQAENPDSGPKLDLGFKDGQTIKLNIGHVRKKENSSAKPRPPAGGMGLLPPPPGAKAPTLLPPPGSISVQDSVMHQPVKPATPEILGDLFAPDVPPAQASHAAAADLWGDFATAPSSASSQVTQSANWVQF
ncbi:adaptin ear-binding coat-associated protein 2-like [Leucoraja erinacea]|uniref:adaptin ear-binding coat-associated protein 2-like n=1 Tax=Leucoraja erinaceus TaxID=7782 RepID=UPI0024553A1F|nr:adaptin ear-binding coat-associated protein 2-like [Leucoraja erinacea]